VGSELVQQEYVPDVPLVLLFVLFLGNFIYCMHAHNVKKKKKKKKKKEKETDAFYLLFLSGN
jgi:Na+-transporting methylmalonyl-CoA/oxaloacetate decarboxylase gamma subunit